MTVAADSNPRVLVVDDHPDGERATLGLLDAKVVWEVAHPQDVTLEQCVGADLVLVDYVLADWPERANAGSISLEPLDGLALASVLRSQVEKASPESPTAFALRSAHLDELSGQLPPEPRAHQIARSNNLDWVFPKVPSGGSASDLAAQITILARAVKALPHSWPVDRPEETRTMVEELMAIPDEPWAGQAWKDVVGCHPPITELVQRTHGLALLRWLLQRILPYPCFLLDVHHMASRLRVTRRALLAALENDLGRLFEPFAYAGVLAGFLGPRWWAAGADRFLWELTDGDTSDPRKVLRLLAEKAGVTLEWGGVDQPVICIDADYRPLTEPQELANAVRIRPDDWPPYADQAWTTTELAHANPRLGALVIEADKPKLAK